MSDSNQRTSIGVLLSSDVKQRLTEIAKNEHRSLSGQAEFFLVKAVEQWESAFGANKEARKGDR